MVEPSNDLSLIKRASYKLCLAGISAYQRLFMRNRVWGREHVRGDPKIFVSNHVSAWDGVWVLPVFTEPVHFVVGAPLALRHLAWVWRAYDPIWLAVSDRPQRGLRLRTALQPSLWNRRAYLVLGIESFT